MSTLTAWLLYAMVLPATLFPIVYSRVPWRGSSVGRSVMTLSVALLLLVDISALSRALHLAVPRWVVVVVFAFINAGLYYQLITLIKVRWGDRQRGKTQHLQEREDSK